MPHADAPNPSRHLVLGRPTGAHASAIGDLTVPAVLLRARSTTWSELVHVYEPSAPTVAFTRRDVRSPGIRQATAIAREAGFEAVVRAPGGRMVAYDEGAVVVDHVTRSTGPGPGAADTFERHAEHHARVLRSLGPDAHVGEVEGEYCPGEFSINVGGRVKVVGSAQRITTTGALFSTVVQVVMSERVREVIVEVSGALGYALRESSIGGLADAEPELTPEGVAGALAADYRRRLHTTDAVIDPDLVALAASAATTPPAGLPFDVDAWARVATTSS